jgi:hypothetical protein
MRKFTFFILIVVMSIGLNSCSKVKNIYKPVDLTKEPYDPEEVARKNIAEGKGLSLKNAMGGNKKTTYQFSTSNEMWRASLNLLDVLPLTTVDYSGGIIITDWYSDNSSNDESIKITVRFLSNEVRADSLKIVVHKKKCVNNKCSVAVIKSKIQEELRSSILKQAASLKADAKKKK